MGGNQDVMLVPFQACCVIIDGLHDLEGWLLSQGSVVMAMIACRSGEASVQVVQIADLEG